MKKLVIALTAVLAAVSTSPAIPPLTMTPIGTLQTGGLRDADPRIAEINAYDPSSRRVYIVDPEGGVLDVIDISTPGNPWTPSMTVWKSAIRECDVDLANGLTMQVGKVAPATSVASEVRPTSPDVSLLQPAQGS